MKKIIQLSILLVTVLLYSGCKKDTAETPAISGLWQITSTQITNLAFVRFNGNKTVDIYSETAEGFRALLTNNYTPGTDQVIVNFREAYFPTAIYNYTVAGNVLTVKGDNGQTVLTATKSTATAPDTWVTDVTSTDQINNLFTSNGEGIGFDGSNLLFVDYSDSKIQKVSLATRTVTASINAPGSLNTIEYDGTNYWISRNGYNWIEKLDLTAVNLFTSSAIGPWIYGIGFVSPTSIVCYSGNDNTLYNFNPVTDAVTSSKLVEGVSLRDMAISNGKVYIVANNFIYRLNATTFDVEKTYRLAEATNITGIASIGSNAFWLNSNEGTQILKVELN